MTGRCHGACTVLAAPPARYSYRDGYKRCSVCEVYYMGAGLRCPCCGQKLKTRPWGHRRSRNYEVPRVA